MIPNNMPAKADKNPGRSCYKRNENGRMTGRMINMIMGTGGGTKANTTGLR